MIKIAYHPYYCHPVENGHKFPMEKYELIPMQLIREGLFDENNFFEPQEIANKTICLVHSKEYLTSLENNLLTDRDWRKIGFVYSEQLIKREKLISQGTLDCSLFALEHLISLNIAGGTHHAFKERGEGFCLLNDIAIAAAYLIKNNYAKRILVIDLDVHQGNGTASIFRSNTNVFTFSMHGGNNYPFKKEISDLDIPLNDGIDDDDFLEKLQSNLLQVLDNFKPDFAFYLSGVDILSTDKFGKLNVSAQGCFNRDLFVFKELNKRNIPCSDSMGGGYSREIKEIVNAHVNTFKAALKVYD